MFYVFCVGLEAPSNIHEGKVTDSSIEILWNRADGNFQRYEITCVNCAAAFMVRYEGLSEELKVHAETKITHAYIRSDGLVCHSPWGHRVGHDNTCWIVKLNNPPSFLFFACV